MLDKTGTAGSTPVPSVVLKEKSEVNTLIIWQWDYDEISVTLVDSFATEQIKKLSDEFVDSDNYKKKLDLLLLKQDEPHPNYVGDEHILAEYYCQSIVMEPNFHIPEVKGYSFGRVLFLRMQ